MAHYAVLDEDNVVVDVFVGRDEDEVVDGITDWEAYYSEVKGMTCKRTSYNTSAGVHREGNTPYRYNYAVIGGTFDPSVEPDGAFTSAKPYPSFVLNTSTYTWEAPVPVPLDGFIIDEDGRVFDEDGVSVFFEWSEEEGNWVRVR